MTSSMKVAFATMVTGAPTSASFMPALSILDREYLILDRGQRTATVVLRFAGRQMGLRGRGTASTAAAMLVFVREEA